jgi:O-6-methylguanine DNA methyltransferase
MLATIDTAPAPPRPVMVPEHTIGYTIVDFPSPLRLGRLLVGATARGVCAVRLGESDAALVAELAREHPEAELRRDGAPLAPWVNTLLRHLAGQEARLDLPLDVEATAFQRRVWQTLRAIPYGETRSYGAVAEAIGHPGAARAVARACAANPVALVIPCHRVVRGNGDPGGYRWGAARKRLLLEQERCAAQLAERRVLRELTVAMGEAVPGPATPLAAGDSLAAGEVLAGRYEVLRLLGAGGMGIVYAARDLELDEIVALKVLRAPSGSEDAAALDRFRHELRLARRISHPHVVRTHDIGEAPEGGHRFITMEYVDGWSLAQLLEQRGTLPLEATLVIGKQLCRALDVVHAQGVIHRDLKPQNVLVTRSGDVKLTDFGIAELAGSATPQSRAADAPRGTLAYMAPEQLLGERVDARADLYATAAVLCECLTGSPPYPATTPESLLARALVGGPPLVAGPLGALLRSALSADGADRPATAAAFHDALAEVEWSTAAPLHA